MSLIDAEQFSNKIIRRWTGHLLCTLLGIDNFCSSFWRIEQLVFQNFYLFHATKKFQEKYLRHLKNEVSQITEEAFPSSKKRLKKYWKFKTKFHDRLPRRNYNVNNFSTSHIGAYFLNSKEHKTTVFIFQILQIAHNFYLIFSSNFSSNF